jgi:hypothetical protein
VWSRRAVAKSWHCFRSSCNKNRKVIHLRTLGGESVFGACAIYWIELIIATQLARSTIAFHTHLVLALELVLEKAESAELPRELEGGQDGIFAGQGDQGRTGQGTVGVDPGAGVAQGVLLPRGDALVAPAPKQPDGKQKIKLRLGHKKN